MFDVIVFVSVSIFIRVVDGIAKKLLLFKIKFVIFNLLILLADM